METAPLKSFATWGRSALIREVTARMAAVLAPGSTERVEQTQAVVALERAVAAAGGGENGRAAVADKVAYIWFNRIVALRFMDANGYTGIGVVSPQEGVEVGQPEILAEAKRGVIDTDVVSEATRSAVAGLLDGTRPSGDPQGEAYALLLADYCRHWNRVMPFMFEREGDFTELLIPSNLLADDSVLNRSVKVLTGEVCEDVEVIGWLYQFYISERKDEVFAGFKKNRKAGANEIPAATQLFTPHWIVRYLVENSLGRLWMLNHPSSDLVKQMDYYVAPVDEEADFLEITSAEDLKVIDPACGSGHMLTYAFELLYAIYEEEGYAPTDIPGLILGNNLYGTEIDPRAGALAAFALTMKARAKQRTFFNKQVEPNICVIEPVSFTSEELEFLLDLGDADAETAFWNQFAGADTLGSLVRPGDDLTGRYARRVETLDAAGDMLEADVIERAGRVLDQATCLSQRYHVVVTNPPYMGSSNMAAVLEAFIQAHLPDARADLFAAFIERSQTLAVRGGLVAMIAKQNWLFRPSFSALRSKLVSVHQLEQVLHFGPGAFDSLSGEVASTAAFVLTLNGSTGRACWFARLTDGGNEVAKEADLREAITSERRVFRRRLRDFLAIPGAPICYWMSDAGLAALSSGPYMGDVLNPREGMATGNNARYLRFWWEVSALLTNRDALSREDARSSGQRWFPYNKGGGPRRWFGHDEYVVDWYRDGHELQTTLHPSGGRIWAHNFNLEFIFREAVSWSSITSRGLALRYYPPGFLFDAAGLCAFPRGERDAMFTALVLVNSKYGSEFADLLNPTHHFKAGDFARLPLPRVDREQTERDATAAVEIARSDWVSQETAPGFNGPAVPLAAGAVSVWVERCRELGERQTSELLRLEQEIQEQVGAALGDESTTVPVDRASITLFGNALYEHGTAEDPESEARRELVAGLVSYAVGCMFGRYSLDETGLILADQGETVQDYLAKVPTPSFAPDADNVIPIVDGDWFEDDIVARFRKFLRVAFGEEHFEENLWFVTESLGVKSLRDYFVRSFYKDHVQRYRKRPIYWLFSSPKGSFNALIYMHRYTPSTVSTVLNEYLREFQAKLRASLEHAERSNNAKEADRLRKVLLELDEYEHDVLYPLASQNIAIDLDDGVKANYPKFGAALKRIPGLEATE
jgi:hypothetical protein